VEQTSSVWVPVVGAATGGWRAVTQSRLFIKAVSVVVEVVQTLQGIGGAGGSGAQGGGGGGGGCAIGAMVGSEVLAYRINCGDYVLLVMFEGSDIGFLRTGL